MSKLKKNFSDALEKNTEGLEKSMKALAGGRDVEPDYPEEEAGKKRRNTAVSFTGEEYEFIKTVFETKARGMKVATGIKMATLYIAERLDAGMIIMGRAGIMERR